MKAMNIKKRLLRMKNKLICKVSPVKYAKSLGVKMGGYEDLLLRCGNVEY